VPLWRVAFAMFSFLFFFFFFFFARAVSRSLVTGTTSVDPLNLLKEMGMVAVPRTLNEMLCK
jgi:hypothetical protein